MWSTFKKVIKDCLTSANGDFDPARVFGYLILLVGAAMFIAMSGVQFALTPKTFDIFNFTKGLGAIALSLTAAAAGVWIKNATEVPAAKSAAAPVEPAAPTTPDSPTTPAAPTVASTQ